MSVGVIGGRCQLVHNMDQTVPPGTNQVSVEQSMNSALAAVKEVLIQDVAQEPYPLRVADHLAAEPAEVQAGSCWQRSPGSRCCRRGDYLRIMASPAWESPTQEEATAPPVTEASPAKSLGCIPTHPKLV